MSYLIQEEIDEAYESTIFAFANGVDYDTMLVIMEYRANQDELEAAEGIRLAILDHQWNIGKQNCRAIPLLIDFESEVDKLDNGYYEEGYEDED